MPSTPEPVNTEALLAWHRARRGGVTIVVGPAGAGAAPTPAWGGVAAIDDNPVGDVRATLPHTPTMATWRQVAGSRLHAIAFPLRPHPSIALLDRDGTIIEDRAYLADPDGVTLLPGAVEGLRQLREAGWCLVVITNQSGIGSGRITPAQLAAVNQRMVALLAVAGVTLDGIYACPHRPDEGCACRKPGTGLADQAAADLGLTLAHSIVVGDKAIDLALARRLGVPAFLVTTGDGATTVAANSVTADYVVDGLDAVARISTHPAGLARAITLAPEGEDTHP